jgi:thiamine biosynthesis lipoprotein
MSPSDAQCPGGTTCTGTPDAGGATLARLGGETMGTSWSVLARVAPGTDLHRLHDGIQARLDRVVAQMSTWEPDSDIGRFNRAGAGTWHELPPEFSTVLRCALDIARLSDGAFDPTLGRLVELWGFGPAARPRMPSPSQRDALAAAAGTGWQRLALQDDPPRALQPGRLALDLSAIAKGFAVDDVAHHLRERGVGAALVEVGGELYGYGRKPDGQPWQVLVETAPEETESALPPCVLALDGLAVATSGDRWHRFDQDGRRFAHTLDARTAAPVADAPAAVTVIAQCAMHADAWATALTVMGPMAGLAFAQAQGLAVRFVSAAPGGPLVAVSDAFQARLAA